MALALRNGSGTWDVCFCDRRCPVLFNPGLSFPTRSPPTEITGGRLSLGGWIESNVVLPVRARVIRPCTGIDRVKALPRVATMVSVQPAAAIASSRDDLPDLNLCAKGGAADPIFGPEQSFLFAGWTADRHPFDLLTARPRFGHLTCRFHQII